MHKIKKLFGRANRLGGLAAVALLMAGAASAAGSQVAAPVIRSSAASGCAPAQTVVITESTAGASIYYTLDGTTPSKSSALYQGPVTLVGAQTIKAIGVLPGAPTSMTATATAGKLMACDGEITIAVGSTPRSFLIHVPASYETRHNLTRPAPLLIDIHGYSSDARTPTEVAMWEVDNSGEKAMSDLYGFIAVWPEASQVVSSATTKYSSWNGFSCCGPALGKVDDVGFIEQVMTWVETNGFVDPGRLYVHGFSNGAQMAQKLACEASTVVSAITAVAFPINTAAPNCKVARPMPVMEVHGTNDQTVLYGGLAVASGGRPATSSAQDGAAVWRQINGCDATAPAATTVMANGISYDGKAPNPPDRITKIKGVNCTNSTYTALITVENAGHAVFLDAMNRDQFNMSRYFWHHIFNPS